MSCKGIENGIKCESKAIPLLGDYCYCHLYQKYRVAKKKAVINELRQEEYEEIPERSIHIAVVDSRIHITITPLDPNDIPFREIFKAIEQFGEMNIGKNTQRMIEQGRI